MKKTKKNNGSKNYKALFFIWLFTFIFMSIGFSGHTSTLAFEGMATIQKHIYDYVYVTHAEVSDYSGGVSNNFSFLDHEIRTDVSLPSCNNYVTYRLSIVNSTPYKAFITQAGLDSAFNGNGAATSSFSVEFLDTNGNPIVINNTFIPRYSSMDIDVKVKNNCTGSDTSGVVTANFEYSLYKYFDLTVNSVSPNNGEITLTTTEGNFTGVGSVTHRVMEGETATYTVKKKYYYDANGTYTMMADDHVENISLIPDPHRDLTINTNVSSSTIIVKNGNNVLCSGSGNLVCSVEMGTNVTLEVGDIEYYYTIDSLGSYQDYSETFNMPATETTKSVTLTERPWITGSTINTSRTTAAKTNDLVNWHPGYYLVELWGGKGGSGDKNPGNSGYIYGVIYIGYNQPVLASAGGNGESGSNAPSGGANGGASGGGSSGSSFSMGGNKGGGGGYSAFVVGGYVINANMINNGYVKFIAAGGGGSSARGGTLGNVEGGDGGNGGNLNSTATSINLGVVFSGANGSNNGGSGTIGRGGSTSAGSGGTGASSGSMLAGGNGYERGGGGGAGYYGGGGGGVQGIFASHPAGGGGGSSFVATGITYSGLSSSITSKLVGTNPSSTGGAVICTFIGRTM